MNLKVAMNLEACVLGSPVSHSLSPKLHGFWLKLNTASPGSYTARDVKPEQLSAALDDLVSQGFAGCNLTLPLKEHALRLMDKLDESSLAAGAVNTVVIRNGKKTGYNSDGFGFLESLTAQHPQWDKSHVVILGAGGAVRGIATALKDAGVQRFSFINRTPEKAKKLIQDLRPPAGSYRYQRCAEGCHRACQLHQPRHDGAAAARNRYFPFAASGCRLRYCLPSFDNAAA